MRKSIKRKNNTLVDTNKKYQLVVMGGSMGSNEIITNIIQTLSTEFTTPMIITRHIGSSYRDNYFIKSLNDKSSMIIKEADQLEPILPQHVYFAPANYHLLVEKDRTLSLSIDEPIRFSRPSIDVLFESAAYSYGKKLIGVMLSGANNDGAAGIKKIQECGGYTLVQDPGTAEASAMPLAAIESCKIESILPYQDIAAALETLTKQTL